MGAGVLCLAWSGIGRTYELFAERPGPERNRRLEAGAVAPHAMWTAWKAGKATAELPTGAAHVAAPVAPKPAVIRVDISGPLKQRAGYHDPCGGWSDGHDAVAERLCAAFAEGDVLLVPDGPGGAAAGIEQSVRRALAAKAQYGRRCTGFIDEQCGSAHVWWTLAVCDEVFLPPMGQIGSIGARGRHESNAEALAKEGVAVTYFSDPPDKVALAPDLPLSPVGAERAMRDIRIMADAFRAAVCASPIGVRRGLTPEGLIALGADMLTGQAAVDAGLADGVATYEDVAAYALKLAETKATSQTAAPKAQHTSSRGDTRARGDSMKDKSRGAIRAEGDEGDSDAMPPSSQPEGEPSSREAPGRDIPTKCAACEVENPAAAKFCMGCGASMATAPAEAAAAPAPSPASPAAAAITAPPSRMPASSSLAEVLGLAADASLPAQKTAAIDMRQVFDFASRITGQRSAEGILGGLSAMSATVAESGRMREQLDDIQRKQVRVERWALAKRLVASGAPGWERGKVYEDAVTESGERRLDKDGKPLIKLSPVIAEMKLGTLRGMVESFERSKAPANPFEPDETRAREASQNAPIHGDKTARIERAKKHPKVVAMADRPGNTLTLDQLAASFVASNFDL